jgi:hypothetical protein
MRKSGPPGREAAGFRDVPPPSGGGSERGIPLLRNPSLGPRKMHRVGLASVQLTRSTFAEATAGRESLQPSALRARCTRKPTGPFGGRQALSRVNVSQIATIGFAFEFGLEFGSRQKRTEGGGSFVRPPNRPPPKRLPVGGPSTSGAPSSVHTGHYGPVRAPSSGNRSRNPQFAIFFIRAAQACVSPRVLYQLKGPGIRRAGCAFVHLPG